MKDSHHRWWFLSSHYIALFGWLWLVAGADLLSEKSIAGWLMLIWSERKRLLVSWLTSKLNRAIVYAAAIAYRGDFCRPIPYFVQAWDMHMVWLWISSSINVYETLDLVRPHWNHRFCIWHTATHNAPQTNHFHPESERVGSEWTLLPLVHI